MNKLNRREFLKMASMAAAGVAGATMFGGCNPAPEDEPVVEEVPMVDVKPEAETVVAAAVTSDHPGSPVWNPPDFSGRTYTIWGLDYSHHLDAYKRLADGFDAYTGAKGKIEAQSWPIEDNVITGMAAGIVPDIVCIMGKQIMPLVAQNALLAVDDVFDVVGCDEGTWFGPVGLQAYQYDGHTWGIPTEGNCVSGVTNVRLDFVKELGLEELWPGTAGREGFESFEEMWALARKLQVEDGGTVTRYGLSGEGWENRELFGIMRTLGQAWWTPEDRKFHMTSPEAEEAMYLQIYRPIFEMGIEKHLGEGAEELMLQGRVAMANGNVTMPPSGREEGILVDSCIYPSAVKGKPALFVGEGGWGFVATAQAENTDIGLAFMQWLCTFEAQKLYGQIYGGMISACHAVNQSDLFDDTYVGDAMRRAAAAQEYTVYYGSGFGSAGEMEGIAGAEIQAVRVGEKDPKQALQDMQTQFEEMLERHLEGTA